MFRANIRGATELAAAALARPPKAAAAQADAAVVKGPSFDYGSSASRLLTPGTVAAPVYTGGDDAAQHKKKKAKKAHDKRQ